MNSPFSAVIICRNEEKYISKCIGALLQITDDIVVVDSGSTDNTVAIATSLGASVYQKNWEGYGRNKNYGNSKAKNDWIISIDADEIVGKELLQILKKLNPEQNTVYQLNSMVNYGGDWIRHSGWFPIWKNRIFNRKECEWNDAPVHENLTNLKGKKTIKLKGHLLHYSYDSVADHRRKANEYAKLKAKSRMQNKRPPSIPRRIFGPSFKFVKTYFLKRGFLDGKAGLNISRINAEMIGWEHKYYYEMKKKAVSRD